MTSRFDDDLVRLWNEIETRRLSGDATGLKRIERLAQLIAHEGDEAQRREAERLLETVRRAEQDTGTAPATARLDAEIGRGGGMFRDFEAESEPAGSDFDDAEPDIGARRWRRTLSALIWVIVFLGILLLNFLGSRD